MTRPAAPIRHLVFDLDGTLVDSCGICVAILSEMLAERGSSHVIDHQGARAFMSAGGAQMVASLLGPDCGDPQAELADFRARYARTPTPVTALFPGVVEGLRQLHAQGVVLSICSNKPQNLCEKVLADTGLADIFTVVVGGQAGLKPKPAPDLLTHTLGLLNAGADECLYVGDSELDHAVAAHQGMPFLFLTYGYADPEWQPSECGVFECFTSLTGSILDRVRDSLGPDTILPGGIPADAIPFDQAVTSHRLRAGARVGAGRVGVAQARSKALNHL